MRYPIFLMLITLLFSNCTNQNNERKSKSISDKEGTDAGWLLTEFLELEDVKQVKITNVNGPHYLKAEQWNEIKGMLKNAKSVGGIRCKPSGPCLQFEFRNGEKEIGCICGTLINFETVFTGSFRLDTDVNFHNY